MKKLMSLLLFFVLYLALPAVNAIEEVVLEVNSGIPVQDTSANAKQANTNQEKTLYEKIQDIKAREINDTSKTYYLFDEILTKKFDNSIIESMRLFGYYRGNFQMNFYPTDNDLEYDYNDIDTGVTGKFRGGKAFYEARLRFTPQDNYNFLQFLPSNMYVATTAIPNHTIIVGNTRTPTGVEGSKSSTILPFVARSQISRNFGNTRKVGVRVKGDYSLIEYDLGGYSSDTYFRKFMPGAEFSGWMTLKPLGKTGGKYGDLKIGSGLTAGQNDIDYCVLGAYASYEYKKFFANFEWGKADGYNGAKTITSNKAEGFYTTLGYKITPKIQLVSRYDQYTPNLDNSNDIRREYFAGVNYYMKGQALKLMLNYVFCQNDISEDSHRLLLGTQILL